MSLAVKIFGTLSRGLFRKTHIVAAIAVLAVFIVSAAIEHQNNAAHHRQQTVAVHLELDQLTAVLENNLNSEIQLSRGLVSTIATDPLMSQLRFGTLARHLFSKSKSFSLVTAAHNFQVSMIYPHDVHKGLFGQDYLNNKNVAGYALDAQKREQIVIVPPGNGASANEIIVWFPVFTFLGKGQTAFWGVLNTVIDFNKLLINSGIIDPDGVQIALSGVDPLSGERTVFFGDPAIIKDEAVAETVNLSADQWQIYAIPKNGWDIAAPNMWSVRALCFLGSALILLSLWFAGVLFKDRRAKSDELQIISRRLEMALKASKIGVWELDVETGELFWDKRLRELYDVPEVGEITYEHWVQRVDENEVERVVNEIGTAIEAGTLFDCRFKLRSIGGFERYIRSVGMPQPDADGRQRVVGVNWDISDEVRLNEQLRNANSISEARNKELEDAKNEIEKIALHDALTGLPNRRYVDHVLAELHDAPDQKAALMHVDLDRFKEINDTLGHAAGDAMLVHAGKILRSCFRGADFVGRIGGDEFVIICKNQCDLEILARLAQRVIDKMSVPIDFEGHSCRCGVSVGIATTCEKGSNPTQLLLDADIALYRAKNQGRNCFEFFSNELRDVAIQHKRLEDEILAGLEKNEFTAYYQGQFSAQTLDISGAEALVRWEHPEKGTLPPVAFMDACEELDLLPKIDELVLAQSLKQMQLWRKAHVKVPSVSVNISPTRLADPELGKILQELEFEPGTLTFELVESTFLDSRSDAVSWNIDQIRERGIEIEIDDFGTGYASILALTQLRPRMLKIDRQLVTPILESKGQRELVRSIVGIGKSLNIGAIAEGVETMEHAKVLNELGCDTLQGYALAKPMSGDDFTKFARKWARRDKSELTTKKSAAS